MITVSTKGQMRGNDWERLIEPTRLQQAQITD